MYCFIFLSVQNNCDRTACWQQKTTAERVLCYHTVGPCWRRPIPLFCSLCCDRRTYSIFHSEFSITNWLRLISLFSYNLSLILCHANWPNCLEIARYEMGTVLTEGYDTIRLSVSTNQEREFAVPAARFSGPGSSVSIVTDYGLDGPGIESRWGARFSATVQTGPGAHPASCTMGTGSFPGVKSGRVVTLTTHHLLVPWSWKVRAIPLLPLWAVRPVQSLSACTRVHFSFYPFP